MAHAEVAPKQAAQEGEEEVRTLKIIHPEGKDAEAFVRSRHVAVGGIGEIHEKDGVMVMEIHHASYNFSPGGGAFITPFKVIRPDEQVMAGIGKFDEVLFIKSKAKPDHWEVAGIMGTYPKAVDEKPPKGWLPAKFVEDRMSQNIFDLPQYRYQGFIDENLKRLKDEDASVRSLGMRMLGHIDPADDRAVMVIDAIAGFIESKDPVDRSAAVRSIGDIGGKHAARYIPRFAQMLEDDHSEKADAIAAICRIGGPEAQKHLPRIVELMNAVEGFPHDYLYHLGQMGEEAAAALPAVLGLLESADKKNYGHMQRIIMTLGEIGPKNPKVVEALTPLLKHEIAYVRDLSKNALDGKFAKRLMQ